MKKLLLTISMVFGLCMALNAQSEMKELTTTELNTLYKTQSRNWKSVHDPSVVWDAATQTFYIYGSHYYGVKTQDFKTYSDITRYYQGGYESKDANKVFKKNPVHIVKRCLPGKTEQEEVTLGSYDASAFASTYASISVGERTAPVTEAAWVSGCQWAPDIIYNPHMGKWCLYLSINGDYWASVVVMLTSDSPIGPFTYEAPIVFGGFDGQTRSGKSVNYKDTDLEVVLGTLSSLPSRYKTNAWGNLWPNCIDPCVFFDEEGELWLAYGSWSGGIFMLKLDKNTGLRDYTYTYPSITYAGTAPNRASFTGYTSDPYFGKLIAGGCYVSGEGPYIQHIGNYYYLFMSYGGFAPDGGYEMRVFRSEKPDGPYKDASGNPATYTSYQLNFGAKAVTNKGMKLIGAMNHWGLMTVGECAQGHNSACQDDKGRTFLVCHTKFNDGTAGHQVRAYQLYLNSQGWLCTAPFQFNGEETTDESIATTQPWTAADVEGDYHVVVHPYKLDHSSMEEVTPAVIHLTADGKVTGDYSGSWFYTAEGKSYIQIRLGSVTYHGVVVEQTLEGATATTLCFTAVSNTGVPCWGYKLQPQYALAQNYKKYGGTYLKKSLFSNISTNKDIVFTPEENVTLSWTSSNPQVFSNTGKYDAPAEDTPFTMTARMECGNYYWTEEYSATALAPTVPVPGDQTTGLLAYYNFDDTPTCNLLNAEERVTYGHSNSATSSPTLESDPSRFGQVVHQYFGARGYNSYSRIPNPLAGQTALDAFTVSLWVKRADGANYYDALWGFFNSTSATADGARLYLTGNSYVGFNDNAGNWFDINYPEKNDAHPTGAYKVVNRIAAGEWHLVTFTYSKVNGYRLYLDGNPYYDFQMAYAGSVAADAFDRGKVLDVVTSAKYFFLGLGSFWGSAEASFDDLMIYNRELSADDVKGLNTQLNRVNVFDAGTVVSIEDLPAVADADSGTPMQQTIFDLMGRPVTNPSRGFYIVNGRKVWFK